MTTFQDLGLQNCILKAVSELGYEVPMPIQEQVIPFLLNNNNDFVALAQTGTGKTAAFGLPILQNIDQNCLQTQALILAPTRELCMQIAKDVESYAKYLPSVKIVPVYGGESIINQYKRLDIPPQIIVATPGRLIDLINRGKVTLANVKFLVLDEADEMLNMGFLDDLETILKSVPKTRRTMLFSATMPISIAAIAKKYMSNATEISVGVRNSGADNVEHIFYLVQPSQRYLALKRVVDINPDIYGIVFCRTRQETKEVADKLMRDGYNADALHGDLSQAQRDLVMNKFRIRNLQLLVATDVAARGLDVSDLTHVINYNIPTDVEIYTHRSGRTGRANKKGVSIALVTQKERPRIKDVERAIGKSFTQENVPNGIDVCRKQLFHLINRFETVVINDEQIDESISVIIKKLEYMDKEEVIRRFLALEFNRFLEYYKDAQDLNVKGKGKDENTDEKGRKKKGKNNEGKKVRFKLNIGTKHNATPRSILNLINEVTNDSSIRIGDIDIVGKYTFFEVFADQAEVIQNAFVDPPYQGLTLAIAQEKEDKFDSFEKKRRGGSDFSRNGRQKDSDKYSSTHNKGGYRKQTDDKSSRNAWGRKRSKQR